MTRPFLPLSDRPWTFEAWIYLFNVTSGSDFPILGQFDSLGKGKSLHLTVRDTRLRIGFFDDDLDGHTPVTASCWFHTAFVFDSVTRNQSLYLDGILDNNRQSYGSYLGTAGALDIGVNYWPNDHRYFNGLIDQLSFTNRSKPSADILRDATLTIYFSFDNNSIHDQGPLNIDGLVVGNTSFVSGRRGQALQIGNVPESYLIVKGLVLLGRHNQSYSFSIWIKPAIVQKSTIIYMSSSANAASGWCLPMIALNSTGQIIIVSWSGGSVNLVGPTVLTDSWTHVVSTYGLGHGLSLYVNGSLSTASAPFSFSASGTPNYLFIGSPRMGSSCGSNGNIDGQYAGVVDELQVYSRELTADEVNVLANS